MDTLDNTLDDTLNDDLAEKLAQPASPAEELERMADLHQRGLAGYHKRMLAARKHCKASLAEMEDERRRLKAQHEADLQRIDTEVSAIKAMTAAEIAAAEKLSAVSRSALEVLAS